MVNRTHARRHHRLSELLDNWQLNWCAHYLHAKSRITSSKTKKGGGCEKVEDVILHRFVSTEAHVATELQHLLLKSSQFYTVTKSWKHKIINTSWVLLLLLSFRDNSDNRQTTKAESPFFSHWAVSERAATLSFKANKSLTSTAVPV